MSLAKQRSMRFCKAQVTLSSEVAALQLAVAGKIGVPPFKDLAAGHFHPDREAVSVGDEIDPARVATL